MPHSPQTQTVVLIAVSGSAFAAFFFLSAAIPKLRNRKYDVTRNFPVRFGLLRLLWMFGPERTMNFSARTFILAGCVTLLITIGAILVLFTQLSGMAALAAFALGALLMVGIYLSVAFDSIKGDNPKTLKVPTHNEDELV